MSIANPEYQPEAALGFDHVKSAQMIAYLVRKAGGTAEKLKLIKLVYLAERLSFQKRGKPMNFDYYFSLPHGPVASSALNGMNHQLPHPAWDAVHQASNKRDITVDESILDDRLSRTDRLILDQVWDEFGGKSASQLRNWTHRHCPEYVEVGPSSSMPIDYSDILSQVGNPDPDNAAREIRTLQKEIGRLRRMRAA